MPARSDARPKMPFFGLWTRALARERGAAAAGDHMASIRVEYGRLLLEYGANSHRGLRRHLNGNILPQLAAYRVLRRAEGPAVALSTVERLHFATLSEMKRQHERLGSLPIVFGLYRVMVPAMLWLAHPSAGWDIEWIENSSERIHAKVHRCFYQRWLEEHGAGELVSIYCRGDDYVFADVGSPYVEWAREKTRPRGDAYCDVRYDRPRSGRSTS